MLINSKMEKHIFILDHPHFPLRPDFEDNTVVMDPSHPTAATTHAEEDAAGDTSAPLPKTRAEQMDLLLGQPEELGEDC